MWKNSALIQSPEEIRRRKNIKKGIDFTLLICGQEGTGKASFINTLCNQQVIRKDTSKVLPDNAHMNPGIDIVKIHVNIAEKDSTPISLDLIMTPGFGDNIDNKSCTSVVVKYLEEQFDLMLNEECRIDRDAKFKDGRPHVLLYFIRATTRGLREMDVVAMKELSTRVNLIPVIAKLDSLTSEELALNKLLISRDIKLNNIPIYDFCIDSDDPETTKEMDLLRRSLPFAICGSYETEQLEGQLVHIRRYPWGVLKVENPDHSDFTSLRNVLFGSHLQELKETTHAVLYENYRRTKLANADQMNSRRISSTNSRVASKTADTEFMALGHNHSLLNLFNTLDENSVMEEDTLREIETKKKAVMAYMADLEALEGRLRVPKSKKNSVAGSGISNVAMA
jgi:septin family protein